MANAPAIGLSSLYGVGEKEKFAEPSIIASCEPDRTKVMVDFEGSHIYKVFRLDERYGIAYEPM